MPNETENNPIIPPTVDDGLKPKATRKPKPIVEGINSPLVKSAPVETKPDWTEAEKKLMSEPTIPIQSTPPVSKPITIIKKEDPRLLPKAAMDRAQGKSSSVLRTFVSLVILAFLAFGGYQFYNWYMDRPSGLEESAGDVTATPTPTPEVSVTPTPSTSPTLSNGLDVPPTPTVTAQTKLKIASTPTGYLNVRSTPATTGEQIARVNPGEVYIYTETQNGWYKIILDSGQSGWVIGTYIEKQ